MVPIEQRYTETVFKQFDPGAHRRLGYMEKLAGPKKAPGLQNRQKRARLLDIQRDLRFHIRLRAADIWVSERPISSPKNFRYRRDHARLI